MKSDDVLREGYKLFLADNNPESNVLVLIFFWNEHELTDNTRTAELIEDDFRKFMRMYPERTFRGLIDLVQFSDGADEVLTPESKEIYFRILKQDQLERVSCIGTSTHIKGILMSLLGNVTEMGEKVQWFSDVRKARDWLFK